MWGAWMVPGLATGLLAGDLEHLPPMPTAAFPWLVGSLLLLWLTLRVWLLRGALSRATDGGPQPKASAWMRALARSSATLPLLALGILGCAAGVWLAF